MAGSGSSWTGDALVVCHNVDLPGEKASDACRYYIPSSLNEIRHPMNAVITL